MVLIALLCYLQVIWIQAVYRADLKIKFIRYNNPGGTLSNGRCCDAPRYTCALLSHRSCDTFFTLTITQYVYYPEVINILDQTCTTKLTAVQVILLVKCIGLNCCNIHYLVSSVLAVFMVLNQNESNSIHFNAAKLDAQTGLYNECV